MGRLLLAVRGIRRLPTWVLVGAVVGVSAAVRVALGREMLAPFIFVDELIYSELAKSLADGGGYAVRDIPISGYSLLYPALVAPAWALLADGVTAYEGAKAIGAVVMSTVAIPAYLLAARISTRRVALLAAATAVAIPSMAYSATMTTESLFYPVASLLAFGVVRWVDRPTAGRLAAVVALLAVALATRSQALGFVPAIATAPLVAVALRGRVAGLRAYAPLWVGLAIVAVGVVVLQSARGRSPLDLLGNYSVVGERTYHPVAILRGWAWHLELLTVYLLLVPVAVLAILVARARRLPGALVAHLAVTLTFTFWSTLVVGAFSSQFASDRAQDRYLFFLVPLFVACVAAWVTLGAPRPRPVTPLAAAVVLAVAAAFPYARFATEPAKSDALMLIPIWAGEEHLIAGSYRLTVAAVGLALVGVLLFIPARRAIAVPLLLIAVFCVLSKPVWTSDKGLRFAGEGALFQGIRGVDRTWIDDAVGSGANVVALWTEYPDRYTINQAEFFNRSLGRVFYTHAPTPGGVGETLVIAGADGVFRDDDGEPVRAEYALLDQTVIPDGDVVARDPKLGTTLWRLSGPLSTTTTFTGLYPDDTWSGRTATWQRLRCPPGRLDITVHSDPTLFRRTQHVVARTTSLVGGAVRETVARARVRPARPAATFSLPVAPDAAGNCVVRFTVSPTATPAEILPGSTDRRILGVHFETVLFTPAR